MQPAKPEQQPKAFVFDGFRDFLSDRLRNNRPLVAKNVDLKHIRKRQVEVVALAGGDELDDGIPIEYRVEDDVAGA
jgi:hypothetical protein